MVSVQKIFKTFGDDFKSKYKMCKAEGKAFKHIVSCRTEVCGFHVDVCKECGHERIMYNSCKDRNCPMCQTFKKEEWINNRKSEVVGARYFHVVFTIPKELQLIALHNKETFYSIMFKASSETIKMLSKDRKYIGACPGFMSVLHTWAQTLEFHPHIHMIVTGGGLTNDNKWKEGSKKFFMPVKVLSKVFRGKFLYYLKKAYVENKLFFFNATLKYENENTFKQLVNKLYCINWYSYAKRPFDGPHAVIEYLGRYTHRISISNNRIIKVENYKVFFKYKDYRDGNKVKVMSIDAVEFIRRFLMHVLPTGFVKIRYYGILANRNKKTKLVMCQRLTGVLNNPMYKKLTKIELLMKVTNGKAFLCPCCGKNSMKRKGDWNLADDTT